MTRIYNKQQMKLFRKDLRNNPTPEELKMWYVFKDYFSSVRVRRQYSFGKFIVDFYIKKYKLVIEIDGGYHDNQVEYDIEREWFLKEYGVSVIRFTNNQINTNVQLVKNIINNYLENESLDLQAPLTKGSSAKR